MRVRQFELRLLAVTLTLFWALGALVVLATYHPGGPVDPLVGLAAALPLPVAVAAIVWPPLVRSDRVSAGIFWLGLVAALLLLPSIWALGQQIVQNTKSLQFSWEVVYPFVLALFATSLFSGVGISRQFISEVGLGRRRIGASVGFAVATTIVIGLLFAGVSLADNAALADKPTTASSRFGPTSASLVPPECRDSVVDAPTAQVDLDLWGDVDGQSLGTAGFVGVRSGIDVSWKGQVARGNVFGQYGTVLLDESGWTLQVDGSWKARTRNELGGDLLDLTVVQNALSLTNRATAEDRGFESVEGAPARRCRVAVDGPTFLATFPQMAWLSGPASVKAWRGQLDYWIFGDGEIGRVEGFVNGASQNILPHGLLATINVRMNAVDRGRAVTIKAPG